MCARDASPDGSSPSRRRPPTSSSSPCLAAKKHLRGILGAVQRTTRYGVAFSSQVLLLWGYGVGDQRCSSAIPEAPARVAVPRTSWAGARRPALIVAPMCIAAMPISSYRATLYFSSVSFSNLRVLSGDSHLRFGRNGSQVQQSNSRTASRCYWWQCTHHRKERARINKGACRIVASPKNGLGHRGGQLRTDPTHTPYSVSGAAT